MQSFFYKPTSFLYTRAGREASTSTVDESHLHKWLADESPTVTNGSIIYAETDEADIKCEVRYGF